MKIFTRKQVKSYLLHASLTKQLQHKSYSTQIDKLQWTQVLNTSMSVSM